ncbi:MAG: hypothetical protein AMXMBFR84_18880 [Candidatus Hydrogenedentota bacterium]
MLYIGRIVCVGMTKDSRLCAGYRVSSRSFPNRTAVLAPNRISIIPKAGHESDVQRNPYIAYNCVRVVSEGEVAVATNGSQTDPIAEKIDAGMPVRDALVLSSLALDYEKDQYDTPRVSAVVDRVDGSGWLAIVRKDGLSARKMPLEPGTFFYVATYEENDVRDSQTGAFTAMTSAEACDFLLGGGVFAERSNPVTAVAAMATGDSFELTVQDAV